MAARRLWGCGGVRRVRGLCAVIAGSAGGERKRPVDQAVGIRQCHPGGEDTEGRIGKHVQAFGLRTGFTA